MLGRASDEYFDALVANDEDRCRQIFFDLYLTEHRLSVVCDRVVAPAFHRIGECWQRGEIEVYQERLACELTRRVLYEMQSAMQVPAEPAPMAIGGTPEGDFYTLPTRMAGLVLLEFHWNAASLGASLPFDTLVAAIRQKRPRLFWLSVSYIQDRQRFLEGYARLYRAASQTSVPIIVGGRALSEDIRREMQYAAYGDNMQHLEAFAATLADVRQASEA